MEFAEIAYHQELAYQRAVALYAYEQAQSALAAQQKLAWAKTAGPSFASRQWRSELDDAEFIVWYHLNAFVHAAAALSRTFFPGQKSPVYNRASHLRATWHVPPASALADRDARNRIEHMDEDFAQHLENAPRGTAFAHNSISSIGAPGPQMYPFRWLDLESLVLTCNGKTIDLKVVRQAILALVPPKF